MTAKMAANRESLCSLKIEVVVAQEGQGKTRLNN